MTSPDRYIERTFGGGTHRVSTLMKADPMAESARFVALEAEAERLMDECGRLTDEALAADQAGNVERARELIGRGNVQLREATRLRKAMTS